MQRSLDPESHICVVIVIVVGTEHPHSAVCELRSSLLHTRPQVELSSLAGRCNWAAYCLFGAELATGARNYRCTILRSHMRWHPGVSLLFGRLHPCGGGGVSSRENTPLTTFRRKTAERDTVISLRVVPAETVCSLKLGWNCFSKDTYTLFQVKIHGGGRVKIHRVSTWKTGRQNSLQLC